MRAPSGEETKGESKEEKRSGGSDSSAANLLGTAPTTASIPIVRRASDAVDITGILLRTTSYATDRPPQPNHIICHSPLITLQ
jgi:hypothetical protein